MSHWTDEPKPWEKPRPEPAPTETDAPAVLLAINGVPVKVMPPGAIPPLDVTFAPVTGDGWGEPVTLDAGKLAGEASGVTIRWMSFEEIRRVLAEYVLVALQDAISHSPGHKP